MKTIPKIFIVIILLLSFSSTKAQNGILKQVMDGNYDKVEQLISAEPNMVDTVIMLNTPLIIAAYFGKDKIAELLLNHGADMYKFKHKNGRTAIHLAAMQNHASVVNVLIRNGVDVNFKDGSNKTALIYAIENNHRDLIDLLLLNNANLPEEQELMNQCLHSAALYDLQDITKSLIKNGAEINSIDCTNRTALNIAHALGHIEIAAFLESKGGILSEPKIFKIDGDSDEPLQIKVTYIANMGVLISSASKTVLIDGLFNESYNTYPTTPKNIVAKINNLEPPFVSLDLILVTHSHGDHFSAPMIADYLAINKSVKVICNHKTSSALKESIGLSADTARIVGITPELCNSTDTLVDDIHVKVLRLRHSDTDGQGGNLGFVIEIDGVNVFHSGDSGGKFRQGDAFTEIQEYDSIGIEEMDVDLAILNRSFLWNTDRPGLQILKDQMKPKHIILAHFSENDKQGEWKPVDNTIKKHQDILPEITLFKSQMQEIIIQKGG